MNKSRILFFDDEPHTVKAYISKLEDRYEVVVVNNVDDAAKMIQEDESIRACVVDIYAPPPKDVSPEDVDGGLLTGVWLLAIIQKLITTRPLAVVALSNRGEPIIQEKLEELYLPETHFEFHRKLKTPAKDLPGIVGTILSRIHGK